MANLSETILLLQRHYAAHGDMPIVFRDKKNIPHDILSCGLCEADDVDGNITKVCWVADRLFTKVQTEEDAEEIKTEAEGVKSES